MTRSLIDALQEEFGTLWQETLHVLEAKDAPPLDWSPGDSPGVNSLATVVIHLCGANSFWVGELVGGQPSGRVRADEFRPETAARATKESLVALVFRTREALQEVLAGMSDEILADPVQPGNAGSCASSHPLLRQGRSVSRLFCLLHALTHHAHHNGQLLLLLRLWSPAKA